MKPLFSLPFTLLAAATALHPASAVPEGGGTSVQQLRSSVPTGNDTRILQMTARPIEDVILKANTVWDLSDNWKEEEYCASYILYGDTLLSETVDGNRRWYNIGRDTVTLVREVALLQRCIPDPPLPTNAIYTGKPPVSTERLDYFASGQENRDFLLSRNGGYSSIPAIPGLLVLAPGDTIEAVMTVEEIIFEEHVAPEHTDNAANPAGTQVFRRYRWFPGQMSSMPVAIQTEETLTRGEDTETVRYAHVIDPSETDTVVYRKRDLPEADNIEKTLREITVGYSGGEITISSRESYATDININIASESGMTFFSGSGTLSSSTPVTVPCASFHPGRYIVAVTCGAHIEKRVVTVR